LKASIDKTPSSIFEESKNNGIAELVSRRSNVSPDFFSALKIFPGAQMFPQIFSRCSKFFPALKCFPRFFPALKIFPRFFPALKIFPGAQIFPQVFPGA